MSSRFGDQPAALIAQPSHLAIQRLAGTHAIFLCQELTLPEEQVRCVAVEELAGAALACRAIVLLVRKEIMA